MLLGLIQDLIGIARRAEITADAAIFELPRWYVMLKVCLAGGAGVILAYFSFLPSLGISSWERIVALIIGIGCVGMAIAIAKGIRRVVVADDLVTLESLAGRRGSWPIRDLVSDKPGGLGGAAVAVRIRSTGKVAFVVPRDLPSWEVLVATIRNSRDA